MNADKHMDAGGRVRGDILIRPTELATRLQEPQLVILDATVLLASPRVDGDYRAESGRDRYQVAHIPGAIFADLLGDLSDHEARFHFAAPRPSTLTDALRSLGIADGKQIVVYDSESGLWAARLWWMLRSLGITARVLDGGLKRWRELGLPVDSSVADRHEPQGSLRTRANPSAWVGRAEVEAIMRREAPGTLVCALSPDVFSGIAPTRYARRGHIPGSLNIPARLLFDANGEYAPPQALAQAHEILRKAARPIVLYCGGGISAAANALALTLLGEREVRIYDGSLEEWAADPQLPLELGG